MIRLATVARVLASSATALVVAASLTGCANEVEDDSDASAERDLVGESSEPAVGGLRDGVNTTGCKRSAYNCHLRGKSGGSQRVRTSTGDESWGIDASWAGKNGFAGIPVLDGDGATMGFSSYKSFTLNYGQTRRLGNRTYVMALSTGLGSAGWVPIDAFVHASSLRDKVGEVNARGAGLKDMACYEVKQTANTSLDKYAVVQDATDDNKPEPDDYLPKVRKNGGVYINLAFSAPGDGLGAPAIDIFRAGTKFQRIDVTTWDTGAPSLDVKLWKKPSGGSKYSQYAGRDMKFVYGYVKTKDGTVRYGWVAYDALKTSAGCPNR